MARNRATREKAKSSVPPLKINVPVPEGKYHALAGMALSSTAPNQYIENEELAGLSVHAALELYAALRPKSALESVLAGLIVGIFNATNDSLSLAAKIPPHELQHRDVNLRHGLKGAAVVAQLVDTLQRVRSNPGSVGLGNQAHKQK